MRKFEFGLFALCVLAGSYFGSMFGMMVAICGFITVIGLFEEISKSKKCRYSRKEDNKC